MSKVKRFQKKAPGKAMSAVEMRQALSNRPKRTIVREFAPGVSFEVQRVDLGAYLAAGLMPQHFYTAMVEAGREAGDEKAATQRVIKAMAELEPKEITALNMLRPQFVVAACVSPCVVFSHPKDESEISLLELPDETQQDIYNWVMAACPGIPIQVGGEEVEVEDLDRFRHKRTGGKPFAIEPDGEPVRDEAQRASGD